MHMEDTHYCQFKQDTNPHEFMQDINSREFMQVVHEEEEKDTPKYFFCMHGRYTADTKLPVHWDWKSYETYKDKHLDTKEYFLIKTNIWAVNRFNERTRETMYIVTKVEENNIRCIYTFKEERKMLELIKKLTNRTIERQDLCEVTSFITAKKTFATNVVTICLSDTTFDDNTNYKHCSIKHEIKEESEFNPEEDYEKLLKDIYHDIGIVDGMHAIIEWLRINKVDLYVKAIGLKPQGARHSLGFEEVYPEDEDVVIKSCLEALSYYVRK